MLTSLNADRRLLQAGTYRWIGDTRTKPLCAMFIAVERNRNIASTKNWWEMSVEIIFTSLQDIMIFVSKFL